MRKLFQTRYVLYDGGCGMCRRTLRWLRYLDLLRKTVPQNIADDWDRIQSRWPQLDAEACLRDMHVLTEDRTIYRGFDGYRSLAWVLPALWPLIPLLYLPPVRWIGWKVYRRVADNRRTCSLPR
jgi:predicted DCC family thiol-disulfide oxidoreductase YuxK